ncbi:MAG: hypothetical protein ACKVT1_04135 [Dehalococcoidia bacterium]
MAPVYQPGAASKLAARAAAPLEKHRHTYPNQVNAPRADADFHRL